MFRQCFSAAKFLALSISLIGAGCQSAQLGAVNNGGDMNTPGGANAIPAAAINRGSVLTDLTGGDLGIGGGFLIAAAPDKVAAHQRGQALAAAEKAEQSPVSMELVHSSSRADLNGDGFITLDEVLAMVRSGLSDREVDERLQQSHFIFHVTPQQQRYLMDRGVSQNVIDVLRGLSGETSASKVSGI